MREAIGGAAKKIVFDRVEFRMRSAIAKRDRGDTATRTNGATTNASGSYAVIHPRQGRTDADGLISQASGDFDAVTC